MTALTALMLIAGLFYSPGKKGAVVLNGEHTEVRWSDGDSFKILSGPFKGSGTRLVGYNTLESYGPVHAWGEWTGEDLYKMAKKAKYAAASQVWKCTADEDKRDHYGRLLATCPDLIKHMVGTGEAHLFTIDGTTDPDALAVQQAAIKAKKGIWAKGVPERVITSLHSLSEKDWTQAYNRVADPKTGLAEKALHTQNFEECQRVCLKGACMLYVPFKRRYGPQRAECLHWGKGLRMPETQIKKTVPKKTVPKKTELKKKP